MEQGDEKGHPWFFIGKSDFGMEPGGVRSTELTQVHGQQCGSCCVSLQGLSAAGLLLAPWRDFTAFFISFSQLILLKPVQTAGCSQVTLAPHPWGERSHCGGMQTVNRVIPHVLGISCI